MRDSELLVILERNKYINMLSDDCRMGVTYEWRAPPPLHNSEDEFWGKKREGELEISSLSVRGCVHCLHGCMICIQRIVYNNLLIGCNACILVYVVGMLYSKDTMFDLVEVICFSYCSIFVAMAATNILTFWWYQFVSFAVHREKLEMSNIRGIIRGHGRTKILPVRTWDIWMP